MKIEAGKMYWTRGGDIVLIDRHLTSSPNSRTIHEGIIYVKEELLRSHHNVRAWLPDGKYRIGGLPDSLDLIEEITDPILIAFLKIEYDIKN